MNNETENLLNGLEREEGGSSSHGDRRSISAPGSRRPEEELFDDLAKFNDGYEPPLYQVEIKRFETSNNLDKNDQAKTALTQQLSRKMSMTNNKRNLKRSTIKKGSGIAEKLIGKRKICRFFSLVGCISFIIGIIIFLLAYGMKSEIQEVNWTGKNLNINLRNCRLFIEPCESCPSQTLKMDYRSSIKTIFYKILSNSPTFNSSSTPTSFTYDVIHYDDILGCNLVVKFPQKETLDSLSIVCNDSCVLIQKTGEFSVSNFTLKGDDVSTNFKKLTVGTLDININKGFIQFNNIVPASGTYTRSILVGNGEIIIETMSPVNIAFETASENYCLSGFSSSVTTAVVNQTISSPLSAFVTQTHLEKKLFQNEWKGEVQLCPSAGCSGAVTFSLYNFDGNIFVNSLEEIPSVIRDSVTPVKGSRYGNSVDIPLSSQLLVTNNIDETYQRTLPNLIIKFVFGNFAAWSTHGSKWVYSDHSIYSIIKPWWLSFFTLGKVVENTNEIQTFLSPGFCPYKHTISIKEHLFIERALRKYLPKKFGVIDFLKPADQNLFPDVNKPDDGFFAFPTFAQFSDEWVEVSLSEGENYTYNKIQLTENMDTFLIICLSVVLSLILSVKMTYKLIQLLFKSFQSARERLIHIEFYWKIYGKIANSNRKNIVQYNVEEDEGREKNQDNSIKDTNIKLSKTFFDLPSSTAFVDYMIMELWTSSSRSLRRFYSMSFEEEDYNKIVDLEMQNIQNEKVPLKHLKSLYQQMCFLIGHKEAELSSPFSLSLLSDKGMVLTNTESHKQYLIRLNMNTSTDLSLSHIKNEMKKTSLELFLELFCEQTNFDEDRIPFDIFVERYALFCKLNHMEQVLIDHLILKSEFGIETRTFLKEMVERDYEQIHEKQTVSGKKNLTSRISFSLFNLFKKKTYYNLKVERLKNINLFLAGKLNEADVGKKEFKKIVELSVMEDFWYLNDFLAVFVELAINIILSVPFLSIFIFQEIEHSSYSLRDESINIYGFNLTTNDIWLLPKKITKNNLLLVMFILFLFFWVSAIFNLTTNIIKLEFPWIKEFEPQKTVQKRLSKLINAYQWWFIFTSFCGILWYISLVVIWDTMVSIINSQAYLATTSMAISFIYMVYSLNKQFSKIWWQSRQIFHTTFKEIWNYRIRTIVKEVAKYIAEKHGTVVEEVQNGVKTSQIVSHEDNLKIIDMNLQKIASESTKNKNFINFFFSLIANDSQLRQNLEKMLLEPPFNFNKYMTLLLCNVLFLSKCKIEFI